MLVASVAHSVLHTGNARGTGQAGHAEKEAVGLVNHVREVSSGTLLNKMAEIIRPACDSCLTGDCVSILEP